MDEIRDIVVIGGGINGCGIAADAALRGLSVTLIEKDDIASKTSSSSSKLIHGGLRYLEYYDFSLVKKALNERQILLDIAPHIVHPLLFVLPYQDKLRPVWLLRIGLFLYDYLSRKNKLPHSKIIKRKNNSTYFSPLISSLDRGFLFYDACTDDARLTIANALQAKKHGALILTRTQFIRSEVNDGLWNLTVRTKNATEQIIKARCVINATGPWAESINQQLNIENKYRLSLVQGSHLVVKKLYEGDQAYLLQNSDKRILFIIPYLGFTLIGTTDILFNKDPETAQISSSEIDYLLSSANRYFNHSLTKADIVTSWSGVRPLISQEQELPQSINRGYLLHFSDAKAPAISVYGGKLTVYRQLGVEAVSLLKNVFVNLKESTTHSTFLPGSCSHFSNYCQETSKKYAWLNQGLLQRLLTTYGTQTDQLLSSCHQLDDLGQDFGYGLFQREVDYLVEHEWALTCEDILWRRTKLGLFFNDAEKQRLTCYLQPLMS